MHLTEEEQLQAMRLLGGIVVVGEDIFKDESKYEAILEVFGDLAGELAVAINAAHMFIDKYGQARGLEPRDIFKHIPFPDDHIH